MSGGMCITVRPGFAPESTRYRRLQLRRIYRTLRRAGLDRHEVRMTIGSVLYCARVGVKP